QGEILPLQPARRILVQGELDRLAIILADQLGEALERARDDMAVAILRGAVERARAFAVRRVRKSQRKANFGADQHRPSPRRGESLTFHRAPSTSDLWNARRSSVSMVPGTDRRRQGAPSHSTPGWTGHAAVRSC